MLAQCTEYLELVNAAGVRCNQCYITFIRYIIGFVLRFKRSKSARIGILFGVERGYLLLMNAVIFAETVRLQDRGTCLTLPRVHRIGHPARCVRHRLLLCGHSFLLWRVGGRLG